MNKITLLHGSNQIIEKPELRFGNQHNDYGKGFYCTRSEEMAQEWACKNNHNGFVNRYALDIVGLNTLDLSDGNHTVLNWIAILLKNRTFRLNSAIAADAREYLIEQFSVDTQIYDLVIGYRADDSYFQYAQSFIENTLPLRELNEALRLGRLGLQTILMSEEAFTKIKFTGAEPVDKEIYYPKFISRDAQARQAYKKDIAGGKVYRNDIFVLDILREGMKNDDPRIQRILSE